MHYDKLINRGKTRVLPTELYRERHHIIPKCLNGTDDDANLVELTAEEHFVAHQLLVKIHPDNKKLIAALSRMCNNSRTTKRSNKWYGWIRNRFSIANSGTSNSSAKFTDEQVLEIYHSTESLDILSKKYKCKRYNITTIKRRIHYKNITGHLDVMPGFYMGEKTTRLPIPIDFIEKIFYDTGDYKYFWEKYRATERVVRGIKNKTSHKHITSKLGKPGQVKRYGMTRDMVMEVYNAIGTNRDIAQKYGIHYNTVRNIKGKNSRALNMWEEF